MPGTLTKGSGPEVTNSSAGGSILHIRLWTESGDGSRAVVSWPNNSSAACLLLDLIKASGGTAEPVHELELSARYPTMMLGMLIARRLQWALQGYAEAANAHGTAAAIVIESAQHPADPATTTALSNAGPGQILLGNAASGELASLPGLAVRESAERGWSEVLWSDAGSGASYPVDEQDLVRMIEKLGRQDPGPPRPKPQVTSPVPEPTVVKTPAIAAPTSSDDLILARTERDTSSSSSGNKRWLMMGAVVAGVALVATLFVVGLRHKSPAPPVAPVSIAAPAAQPDKSTKPDHKNVSAEVKPVRKETKAQGVVLVDKTTDEKDRPGLVRQPKDQRPGDEKASKAEAGSCELTVGEIPRSLERAKNDMHQGKLYEAQAAFLRVLGCPSAHEEAQAGLSDVRRKLEVQGLPLNPE